MRPAQNLELLGAILIKESNRDTHNTIVVGWNSIGIRNIKSVKIDIPKVTTFNQVLMLTITEIIIHRHKT